MKTQWRQSLATLYKAREERILKIKSMKSICIRETLIHLSKKHVLSSHRMLITVYGLDLCPHKAALPLGARSTDSEGQKQTNQQTKQSNTCPSTGSDAWELEILRQITLPFWTSISPFTSENNITYHTSLLRGSNKLI